MSKLIDLTGKRFGRLSVVRWLGNKRWLCRCDCGVEKEIKSQHIREGLVRSCGCYARDQKRARKIDLRGKKYGRLLVIAHVSGRRWLCRCRCGREKVISDTSLRPGGTTSCGCKVAEANKKRLTTHGMTYSMEYGRWEGMWSRCTNEKELVYSRYGGRGIKVCDRWKTFENFFADMGPLPSPELSIDRIDNDGDYEPGNCRWSTDREQRNNRRDSVKITFRGKTQSRSEWAEELGIRLGTLGNRQRLGWSIERMLTEPVKGHKPYERRRNKKEVL